MEQNFSLDSVIRSDKSNDPNLRESLFIQDDF